MYDPKIGRWLNEDPIGFRAGDPNLFRYVGNAPSSATDALGLQQQPRPGNQPQQGQGQSATDLNNARQQQIALANRQALMQKINDQQQAVDGAFVRLLGLVFQWDNLLKQLTEAAKNGDIRAFRAIQAQMRAVDAAYAAAQKALYDAELALQDLQGQLRNLP
jgi:uncharacterized protein RhaS with RHS repeats